MGIVEEGNLQIIKMPRVTKKTVKSIPYARGFKRPSKQQQNVAIGSTTHSAYKVDIESFFPDLLCEMDRYQELESEYKAMGCTEEETWCGARAATLNRNTKQVSQDGVII